MNQSTTPDYLTQTIWPRWASRQFLTVPIVETLPPVTFGYFLSSQAVVMRWKRLWHAHTRGLPWGLAEVVGTVQREHCSRRRLLRRGLEFYVCTINRSAHTKKVWKLIVCPSYMNKLDLALNSLQWLICHKTKPNQRTCWKRRTYLCCKKYNFSTKSMMSLRFFWN